MGKTPRSKPLPARYYARPTISVALDLLGKTLAHETPEGLATGRIVEVEAYLGDIDPASHAYGGRGRSTNNLWGRPGIAYVYFTYGMHYCMNAVTEQLGVPGGVLLRAVEPLEGMELMQRRRRVEGLVQLTNGPGKLTQAFAIGRAENGADLTHSALRILDADSSHAARMVVTGRIGISRAEDEPLRYYLEDNRFVSRSVKHKPLFIGTAGEVKQAYAGGRLNLQITGRRLLE